MMPSYGYYWKKKEHLTLPGIYKILSIKSLFPKGVSPKILKAYLP